MAVPSTRAAPAPSAFPSPPASSEYSHKLPLADILLYGVVLALAASLIWLGESVNQYTLSKDLVYGGF